MRELGPARDTFERIAQLVTRINELEAINERQATEIIALTEINDWQTAAFADLKLAYDLLFELCADAPEFHGGDR